MSKRRIMSRAHMSTDQLLYGRFAPRRCKMIESLRLLSICTAIICLATEINWPRMLQTSVPILSIHSNIRHLNFGAFLLRLCLGDLRHDFFHRLRNFSERWDIQFLLGRPFLDEVDRNVDVGLHHKLARPEAGDR